MEESLAAPLLLNELSQAEWDLGWNYTGMGQFGASSSPTDALIMATAYAINLSDVFILIPHLVRQAQLLIERPASPEFSHCRALAIACERLGSPAPMEAVELLGALLAREEMQGYHFDDLVMMKSNLPTNKNDTTQRNNSLRELSLAPALYRCGDNSHHLGENILKNYTRDLRGTFAKHASEVLLKGIELQSNRISELRIYHRKL